MGQTVTEKLEQIKGLTGKGADYWHAKNSVPVLGYVEWRNFQGAIERAKVAFNAASEDANHHFVDTTRMVMIGSGAEKEVADYFLSRAACYLIAMNGDVEKPEIAEAQKYFAIQTRKMEKLEKLIGDQRRVTLRNRVKDRNSKLNSTAHRVGVKRLDLLSWSRNPSYVCNAFNRHQGQARGIGENEDWLDRQGVEELAANEFRITQADAKIRRDNIQGEQRAIHAHAQVGSEVRQAIQRLGNTMPEELAPEPPIREIEKRLGAAKPEVGR